MLQQDLMRRGLNILKNDKKTIDNTTVLCYIVIAPSVLIVVIQATLSTSHKKEA